MPVAESRAMAGPTLKPRWEAAEERWTAWWHRELTDGPLLGITAPRKQAEVDISAPPTGAGQAHWSSGCSAPEGTDLILELAEAEIARTAYLGEAFPHVSASLGPGSLGVFLGAQPQFGEQTVWYEPCFDDVRAAELVFDLTSRWWQWTVDVTRTAVERSRGRYLVAMPDLIENLDTLAALIKTDRLLYALIDWPREVHRLQERLVPLWFEAFDALCELIGGPQGGISWIAFLVWAPGTMAKLQCDMSSTISAGMFSEFVLPYLHTQCDGLDYSLYHLDGPGALHHLDHLLSIDSLDCIQWTPGAGQPGGADPRWDDIYRRVLDAGKLIQTQMAPGEIGRFVQRFDGRHIYILTRVASEEEGLRLLGELRS